ncbi:MAG: hypothetical protein K0R83_1470, partial [Caulobacter sp.]|nr:hypothetical protein [Caulobacter sp.]
MSNLNAAGRDEGGGDDAACSFDAATLDFLFPCRFEVGDDLAIQAPAPRLLALAPAIAGAGLTQTFIVEAATPVAAFADLAALDRKSVFLHSRA